MEAHNYVLWEIHRAGAAAKKRPSQGNKIESLHRWCSDAGASLPKESVHRLWRPIKCASGLSCMSGTLTGHLLSLNSSARQHSLTTRCRPCRLYGNYVVKNCLGTWQWFHRIRTCFNASERLGKTCKFVRSCQFCSPFNFFIYWPAGVKLWAALRKAQFPRAWLDQVEGPWRVVLGCQVQLPTVKCCSESVWSCEKTSCEAIAVKFVLWFSSETRCWSDGDSFPVQNTGRRWPWSYAQRRGVETLTNRAC